MAWQWAYSAFGDEQPTIGAKRFTSESTNPTTGATSIPEVNFNLRYPGQYFDKETKLHYNYFRSYAPGTGRYTQGDPIGLDGGWNRFGYVEGNPLSFVDPEGLQFLDLTTLAGARRNTTLDDAIRAGAWTRAVTMPAITAGLMPSVIGLVGSAAIPACSTAANWYMLGAEADAAWLNLSMREKLLYEIGQKTTTSYARYSSLDPVARGASLVADFGWRRALTPEIGGVGLGVGSTFGTGPTSLFRWLMPKIVGGAVISAPLAGDSDQCSCRR